MILIPNNANGVCNHLTSAMNTADVAKPEVSTQPFAFFFYQYGSTKIENRQKIEEKKTRTTPTPHIIFRFVHKILLKPSFPRCEQKLNQTKRVCSIHSAQFILRNRKNKSEFRRCEFFETARRETRRPLSGFGSGLSTTSVRLYNIFFSVFASI